MPNEFIVKNGLISQGNITISGSITATGGVTVSGSIASASYASNAELLDGLDSTVFTLTSSFNAQTASFTAFTSSMNSFSASILTNVTALNAKTASFATTGSNTFVGAEVISGSLAISGSGTPFTLNTDTLEITGSLIVTGSTTLTGSLLQLGNFTTTGTIIAQTINVQTVTSSIVYSSGSNVFGNSLGNSQTFTGSVLITGSLTIAGASSATSYNGATIFGSTIACSPIGCFATSCATSFIGGTMSGTTIYGSTAVCSPVGCFATSCATSFIGGTMSGTCIIVSSKIIVGGTSGDIGSDLLRVKGTIITDNNAGYLGYSSAGNRFELAKISSGDEIALGAPNSPGAVALISGTGQDLILRSNGTCERIRITSAGNVGIGTNSPNFKTHISTGSDTSITQPTAGTYGLYIQQNSSGNVGGLYIQDGASNSGNSIFVGDNNGAVRFVVNTDGNVGIGISSPSSVLDVQSAASIIKLKSTTGTNSVYTNYENCSNFYVGTDSTAGGSFGKACAAVLWQVSCNSIVFATSNTEQMRITGGGNVGINNIAPLDKLDVAGNIRATVNTSYFTTFGYTGGTLIRMVTPSAETADNMVFKIDGASSGTAGNQFIFQTQAGNTTPVTTLWISKLGDVNIGTTTSTKYQVLNLTNDANTAGAAIGLARSAGQFITNAGAGDLIIGNTTGKNILFGNTGAGTTEYMRITSGGNVSINTSTTAATLNLKAQSNCRAIIFQNPAGADGSLWLYGTSNTINYSFSTYSVGDAFVLYNNGTYDFAGGDVSDIRLKENITTIDYNATEKLMQLVPKSYNMTKHPDTKRSGFIAQEVKEVLPDFVIGEETEKDYLGLDYNGILVLTVKAIQEQQCTICSQASMINTLKTCLGII